MASATRRAHKTAEFLGLVSFALSLMLLISLATYNPADPAPFFKAGAERPRAQLHRAHRRLPGRAADPAALRRGRAAACPSCWASRAGSCSGAGPSTRRTPRRPGLSLLLVSLTALLTLTFGTVTIEGESVRAGGAAGQLAAAMLTASFNRTGAYIVLATSLFVSLILATQFSFAAFLSAVGRFLATRAAGPAHGLGPLPGDPAQGEDAPRGHPEAHQGEGGAARRRTPAESVPRVRKVKAAGSPAAAEARAGARRRRSRCPSPPLPTRPRTETRTDEARRRGGGGRSPRPRCRSRRPTRARKAARLAGRARGLPAAADLDPGRDQGRRR